MGSAAIETREPAHGAAGDNAPVVVVGAGPVGVRLVDELVKHDPHGPVLLYGDEPWEPYNRVRLSGLLAGELAVQDLANLPVLSPGTPLSTRFHCRVTAIDPATRTVRDAQGRIQPYAKLVLATGSRPHVPHVGGTDLPGVYTFRDLGDAQGLVARRARSRHTVVVGGGLLGLEAARAMQRGNTQVSVVEHAPCLMAEQLDGEAAEQLREHVLALGIRVFLADGIKVVLGADRVQGVRLQSGRQLACDTVVFATGIRPNVELALQAGLHIGRGIRVNDRMESSQADIFAVGECAEHRGRVHGLVAPGLEQAAVAAHNIVRGRARYTGSIAAARLKVVGQSVFSIGAVGDGAHGPDVRTVTYRRLCGGAYRRVLLRRGRLVGACGVGDWPETGRIQEAVQHHRRLWPWQVRRFRRQGALWGGAVGDDPRQWPASATVCTCTGVTRAQLSKAAAAGQSSVEQLSSCTGAGSVCGSCRPLLARMAGAEPAVQAEGGYRLLLGISLLSLLAALMALWGPAVPYAETVDISWQWDSLWRDSFSKQVSGFSLLGLSIAGLVLSLRKRWRRVTLGGFSGWRLLHVVLGVLAVGALAVHTGFRLGHNLNFALMTVFLAMVAAGALTGGVTAVAHRIAPRRSQRLRLYMNRVHIGLLWPVPVLLGFHVLKTYYF